MKNLRKFFGALLLVASILFTLSGIQLNWSMLNAEVINLTFAMHIMQIITVALVIVLNKNILVDYAACLTLLISGVKPANTVVNHLFGKIEGVIGAAVPVVLLIVITLVIVVLFYMAYKTNKLAVSKTLVVVISCTCLIASIVAGFLVNAIAESTGVSQIGLVAESLLAAIATVLMIISFFLTKEDKAKVVIVIATLLTWWPIINDVLISRVVRKIVSIESYTLKGLLPIFIGMLAVELLRIGLILLFKSNSKDDVDDDEEEEAAAE